MIDRKEYFECQCQQENHMFRVDVHSEDMGHNIGSYKELYILTQANIFQPFWKRFKVAFLHILGKRQSNHYWDSTLLRGKDVDRLISILEDYKKIDAKEFDE